MSHTVSKGVIYATQYTSSYALGEGERTRKVQAREEKNECLLFASLQVCNFKVRTQMATGPLVVQLWVK